MPGLVMIMARMLSTQSSHCGIPISANLGKSASSTIGLALFNRYSSTSFIDSISFPFSAKKDNSTMSCAHLALCFSIENNIFQCSHVPFSFLENLGMMWKCRQLSGIGNFDLKSFNSRISSKRKSLNKSKLFTSMFCKRKCHHRLLIHDTTASFSFFWYFMLSRKSNLRRILFKPVYCVLNVEPDHFANRNLQKTSALFNLTKSSAKIIP